MADKHKPKGKKKNNTVIDRVATQRSYTHREQKTTQGFIARYRHLLIPMGIALVTWLFLNACLANQLTEWDDPGYIRDNTLIKNFSPDGIKAIFSPDNSVMGNYHPLTILSYAIEYSYARLDPWLYHFDSLLLHILATMLVYWLVLLLTKRHTAAAITALLFGLHPMHVESVAWLSGRKDVLYASFYFAACIAYVYYTRTATKAKWGYYALTLFLFTCSLLAKPVAVTLPLSLLLIDYWEKRKFTYTVLTEKIPHFALALLAGIQSIADQQKFGAMDLQHASFNFMERIALGCYALVTYLWKAVLPIDLCAFYPYPEKPGGDIHAYYYLYPVIVAAMLFLCWKFLRRNRVVMFGLAFFLVNIALLLQFIPVGGAILADRYTYIPYVGLFFIAAWYISSLLEQDTTKWFFYPLITASLACIALFGFLSRARCAAWYDSTSLWRDEISKNPGVPNAYNDLGFNYFNKFNATTDQAEKKVYYDSAYYLLNTAIAMKPDFVNSYISLGELLRSTGQFPEAKKNYYKALSLNTKEKRGEAYLGLAIIYAITHRFDSSAFCFKQAIASKEYFPEAHSNYGNLLDMLGHPDSALVQYGIAIAQNPDQDQFHLNRGRTLMRMNRWNEAMSDFEQAIAINPGLGDNYYARSMCYAHMGNKAMALADVRKAMSLGFTHADNNYVRSLQQ